MAELNYELNPVQQPGEYKISLEILDGKEVIEKTDQQNLSSTAYGIGDDRAFYSEVKVEYKF